MKTCVLFLFTVLLASAGRSAEEPVPTPLPADRYAAMASQSPFALATVTAPPPPPQASFAANWFVSGLGRHGDADFVSIKSRDAAMQFSLFGREPNTEHGVAIASVNWSETVGKSTVILQKGTETAKLEFNEADLRGPQPGPAGPNGVPPGPGAGNVPPNLVRKPAVGQLPAPPGAGFAPPPVVTPTRSLQQFPGGTPKPIEIRRRERVIPVPR